MDVVGDLTVDQSSSHFVSNYNENSKEKRKRTNSIMQIENKIVKGWNQMIYDLTPKLNHVGLGVSSNADDDRVDLDISGKKDYRNLSRLPETTLKLDLVELDTKKYRCRSTAQISPTCKNYIIFVFTL